MNVSLVREVTPISSSTRTVSALEVGSVIRASTSCLNASSLTASNPRSEYTRSRACHSTSEDVPVTVAS